MTSTVRIGTRGSPLALVQARLVARLLVEAHAGLGEPEIVTIKTTGDRVQDRALAEIGGKGLFTKEIEDALLSGAIDVAVHSMKDMQTRLPEGLVVDCVLKREDARDALISSGAASLRDLPAGASLGTASVRRAGQALALRPDLKIAPLRGNVGTRLDKIARGDMAATLLALAGLKRLGLALDRARPLSFEEMLPAAAQGAIGVERRLADERMASLLAALDHAPSSTEVTAERALLAALDGNCRTPIAALARALGDRVALDALTVAPDGTGLRRTRLEGLVADAARLGDEAGRRLKQA